MWSFFRKRQKSNELIVVKGIGKTVRVEGLNFIGQSSESPDGRYLFAWSDADRENGRGGYREHGFGSYLLAEDKRVIVHSQAERPNDGKVSDNGTFIFNDYMLGPGLKGTFFAYDKSGKCIVSHAFTANLLSNALSEDGQFAACQLANSDTDDAGALAFFDLARGALKWKIVPETGWTPNYKFSVIERKLTLLQPDGVGFDFDFDGNFLDQEKLDKLSFDSASGFTLHERAKRLLQFAIDSDDKAKLQEVYELLKIALTRNIDKYPNEQASIHRAMGEILEAMKDAVGALNHYELALSLNPKVGLKRRVATLKGL
jgi:tetratricopeptide (TPR) repeat protein